MQKSTLSLSYYYEIFKHAFPHKINSKENTEIPLNLAKKQNNSNIFKEMNQLFVMSLLQRVSPLLISKEKSKYLIIIKTHFNIEILCML